MQTHCNTHNDVLTGRGPQTQEVTFQHAPHIDLIRIDLIRASQKTEVGCCFAVANLGVVPIGCCVSLSSSHSGMVRSCVWQPIPDPLMADKPAFTSLPCLAGQLRRMSGASEALDSNHYIHVADGKTCFIHGKQELECLRDHPFMRYVHVDCRQCHPPAAGLYLSCGRATVHEPTAGSEQRCVAQ